MEAIKGTVPFFGMLPFKSNNMHNINGCIFIEEIVIYSTAWKPLATFAVKNCFKNICNVLYLLCHFPTMCIFQIVKKIH